MAIDPVRVQDIVGADKATLFKLGASMRGIMGYLTRVINQQLRESGNEALIGGTIEDVIDLGGPTADLANNLAIIRGHYVNVIEASRYEAPFETLSGRKLLDSIIEQKKTEVAFLAPAQEDLTTMRPGWGEKAGIALEPIVVHQDELERMITLWRFQISHMWYRKYKARDTPTPFAMSSCFIYTTDPAADIRATLNSAIAFLENDEAFSSFKAAKISQSVAAKRGKHPTGGGAFYETVGEEVDGFEMEEVDWDEIENYKEDEVRYYVGFYKTENGIVKIYLEYWGALEMTTTGWRVTAQQGDKSMEPLWKRAIDEGWPEGSDEEMWERQGRRSRGQEE